MLPVMQMVPEPAVSTFIQLTWPTEQALQVMELWQAWAPNAPDAMSSDLQVLQSGEPVPV